MADPVTTLIGAAVLGAVLLALGVILWMRYQSRRALVRQVAELSVLTQASARIGQAQLDVDALCALICDQARQVVSAATYQIGLYDGEGYDVRFWLVRGERRPAARLDLGSGRGGELIAWVRAQRQAVLVRDFPSEAPAHPAHPRTLLEETSRSALFVPMLAGADVVGVIGLEGDRPRAFSQDHLRLLSIIASQSAAAIQNARLLQQARTRARQLELIGRVGRQVAAILELDELFVRVVTLVQETFGYYCVEVFTLDTRDLAGDQPAAGGRLILEATTSATIREHGLPVEVGEGIIGWVALTGESALVNDVTSDPRYRFLPVLSETRAELAVPLRIEQRVLGVLDVQSARAGGFTDDDRFVLETLGDQIAVAIHEARVYRAARRRAQQLDAIAQVSRAVVSLLDLDELLTQVVDLIAGRFRYPQVGVFLLDEATGDAVFHAGTGPLATMWREMGLRYAADAEGMIPWVARYGEALLAADVTKEPRYRTGPGEEGRGSELCVPLRMGGNVLGVLDMSSPDVSAFGEDDLFVAQTLADAVAVAVRNAMLYASERRRREAAEAMRQVAETLTSTLDLQSVLGGILTGLARVVHYDAAAILLLHGDGVGHIAAAQGLPAVTAAVGQTLALGQAAGGQDDAGTPDAPALSRLPVEFMRYDTAGAYHALLNLPPEHACLGAPLIVHDELIGFLVVDALPPRSYDAEDAEMIMTFANQAAMAIDNARLFTTQREEAWVSTALLQVAEATGRSTELEEVLATVTRITPLLVGVDRCGLVLWEEEFDIWRGTHAYQTEGGWIDPFANVRLRRGEWPALDQLHDCAEPLAVEPAPSAGDGGEGAPPAGIPDDVLLVFGRLSLLLLPLMAKGRVMGAMIVGHSEPTFSQRRIELISGIANQAALAIDGAQLYTAQQEEVWVSTALLQVAEAVGSLTDVGQVLASIVRLAPLLVGVERCAVLLWDDLHGQYVPGEVFGLAAGERDRFDALRLSPMSSPLLNALRDEAQTEPIAAGPDRAFAVPASLGYVLGVEGLLALPLSSKGQFLGTMLVDWPASAERAGRRRMNILVGMAHQVALALESARLYANLAAQQRLERELEVARAIQMSFLPEACPVAPGWEVDAFYQAAHSVGGDFYDFIPLPDGRWGIVVADVSDKGIGAALFMALSRTMLRAVAISGRTPGASLSRVNDMLLADARTDMFVTSFYAAWNPENARLVYACAGHNPPLLVTQADGSGEPEAQWLSGKGIALGVVANIQLEEQLVRMAPGDVLVLYTDGVTEALANDNSEFGANRLADVVVASRGGSAREVITAVRAAVDAFIAGAPQFDDFTLVVLKRIEGAEPGTMMGER